MTLAASRSAQPSAVVTCALAISPWRLSLVAHVAQLTGRIAFAVQPRISIRGGCVGVIAAGLAFEVATIAIVAAVLAYKCTCLDEGAIHAEVFA